MQEFQDEVRIPCKFQISGLVFGQDGCETVHPYSSLHCCSHILRSLYFILCPLCLYSCDRRILIGRICQICRQGLSTTSKLPCRPLLYNDGHMNLLEIPQLDQQILNSHVRWKLISGKVLGKAFSNKAGQIREKR